MGTSAFTPSNSAVEGLQNSIMNLAGTWVDKLDQANATMQFNNGQEILRRSMNQFELNLQSDPDWRTYDQKAQKFIDDTWKTVDGVVKHQGAKNALNQWWMDQRDSLQARVGESQLNGKRTETIALANGGLDQVMKDASAGADPAQLKIKVSQIENTLLQGNMTDRVTMQSDIDKYNKQIDMSSLVANAFDLLKTTDPNQIPDDTEFLKFLGNPKNIPPGVTDEQVQSVRRQGQQFVTVQKADYDNRAKQNNDKYESPIEDAIESGNIMQAQKALHDSKFMNMFGGESSADIRNKWQSRIDSRANWLTSKDKANKTIEPNGPDFQKYMALAHRGGQDPGDVIDSILNSASAGNMTWEEEKQIESVLDPKVKAKAAPYEKLFSPSVFTIGMTGTDPKVVAQKTSIESALNYNGGIFDAWLSTHMDATSDQMATEAQHLHDEAIKGIVEDAATNIYIPKYEITGAQALGQPPADKPAPATSPVAEVTDNKKLVAGLQQALSRNIAIPKYTKSLGDPTLKGKGPDGHTYYLVSGKWYLYE